MHFNSIILRCTTILYSQTGQHSITPTAHHSTFTAQISTILTLHSVHQFVHSSTLNNSQDMYALFINSFTLQHSTAETLHNSQELIFHIIQQLSHDMHILHSTTCKINTFDCLLTLRYLSTRNLPCTQ